MTPTTELPGHVRVAVGAGSSGLGTAGLRSGERDVVGLERADDVGGTGRDDTRPGCACDVPAGPRRSAAPAAA